MKDVTIKIHSYQDGDERSFLYVSGQMDVLGDKYKIDFNGGADIYGNVNDRFSLEIESRDKVTMTSGSGRNYSSFVFQKGIKHHCHYVENDHLMVLGVDAQSVRSDIDDNGGELELKYIIDYNNSESITNVMRIKIDVKNDTNRFTL